MRHDTFAFAPAASVAVGVPGVVSAAPVPHGPLPWPLLLPALVLPVRGVGMVSMPCALAPAARQSASSTRIDGCRRRRRSRGCVGTSAVDVVRLEARWVV